MTGATVTAGTTTAAKERYYCPIGRLDAPAA